VIVVQSLEGFMMSSRDFDERTVGALLADQPTRAAVFDKYKIDFCCGGGRTLAQACQKSNVDLKAVIDDLLAADAKVAAGTQSAELWVDKSMSELADHIVSAHHNYIRAEGPRLAALAQKVSRVHGENHPEMIELEKVFAGLKREIDLHTMKEEQILFPYIRSLESNSVSSACFGTVAHPIRQMEFEHAEAGECLQKMRELTNDYTPPSDACNSWRALLDGLKRFDDDLRVHVHKESSILFPKAVAVEEQNRAKVRT
jgi:regulator of cell morphogenesis and NO signaling